MHQFIVTVICAIHLKACPIPQGKQQAYQAPSKKECIDKAKSVIATFGYAAADFNIKCEEK